VLDAALAGSLAQVGELWRLRENCSEAQKVEGISIKHDVSVPVSRIPDFLEQADAALRAAFPGVRIVAFGHVGDGNLHYNLSKPVAADNADFIVLEDPYRGLQFVGFNTARPPFDNADFRRAVAQAINKQDILDIVAPGGLGRITSTPIPPSVLGYNPDLEAGGIAYDPDAAREFFAAAGDLNVKILSSNFPVNQQVATIVQAQLADVGVDAEIEVLDFAANRLLVRLVKVD